MALTCSFQNRRLQAVSLSTSAWAELKAESEAGNRPTMECCGAPAVLKQTKQGTRYFAHLRRGPCTVGESIADQEIKSLIAKAAAKVGWGVELNHIESSPVTGQPWFADVLLTSASNQERIALSLSDFKPYRELRQKSKRYLESGVRHATLMRKSRTGKKHPLRDIPTTKMTPVFLLAKNGTTHIVRVSREENSDPLQAFVTKLLRGNLRYEDHKVEADLLTVSQKCDTCKVDYAKVVGANTPRGAVPLRSISTESGLIEAVGSMQTDEQWLSSIVIAPDQTTLVAACPVCASPAINTEPSKLVSKAGVVRIKPANPPAPYWRWTG